MNVTEKLWEPDTYEKLAGWCAAAGFDLEMPRGIKDHPAIGKRVRIPRSDGGIATGIIDRCIIHPRGYLLFDVTYDDVQPWSGIERNGGGLKLIYDPPRPDDRGMSGDRFSGEEIQHYLVA